MVYDKRCVVMFKSIFLTGKGKVAVYEINVKKNRALSLYVRNEQIEFELKSALPLRLAMMK